MTSYRRYLPTSDSRDGHIHALDLLAVIALSALGTGAALGNLQPTALRALLAGPLVLFLPGYALVRAVLPPKRFPPEQRLMLGLGASLSVTIGLGLLLNMTARGLQTTPWVGSLAAVAVLASAVAWWRWRPARRLGPSATAWTLWAFSGRVASWPVVPDTHGPLPPYGSAPSPNPQRRRTRSLGTAVLAAVVAAILAGGSVAIANLGAQRADSQVTFTELWMLPGSAATPATVDLGVRSHQLDDQAYRLVLTEGTSPLATWVVHLQPGQQWQDVVPVPPPGDHPSPLSATLYPLGSQTPYRHVDLPANAVTSVRTTTTSAPERGPLARTPKAPS